MLQLASPKHRPTPENGLSWTAADQNRAELCTVSLVTRLPRPSRSSLQPVVSFSKDSLLHIESLNTPLASLDSLIYSAGEL